MADRSGIDIPPDLDRVFIVQELLESSGGDYREASPLPGTEAPEISPVKQYNSTCVEVLIRDPLWVFVFWDINSHDRERFEGDPDFNGYCLRVLSPELPVNSADCTFSVRVGLNDTSWYLGFPSAGGGHRVELCVLAEERIVLAVSRPFTLPALLDRPGGGREIERPLITLSGRDAFPVLRNTERQSRLRSYET
jgi:hypothetical protein